MELIDYRSHVAFDETERVKSTLVQGEHCRGTLFCLEIGQSIKPHIHAGDHLWIIQEGSGLYLNDEGEHPVSQGSIVFAPEGEPHGIRATSRLVFISVSAG